MRKGSLRLILVALTVVSIGSCAQKAENRQTTTGAAQTVLLSAVDFLQKINTTPEKQIIDVRTPDEFKTGHLADARNMNIYDADFAEKIKALDKHKTVFVYCKSGGRSGEATDILKRQGFDLIYDMKGGIMSWNMNNLPLEKGEVALTDQFTRKDYDQLLQGNELVIIDFYASWCGPCKKMEPDFEKLKTEYVNQVKFVRINVDEAPSLAKELGIENIPLITTHKHGSQIQRVVGYQSEEALRGLVAGLLK